MRRGEGGSAATKSATIGSVASGLVERVVQFAKSTLRSTPPVSPTTPDTSDGAIDDPVSNDDRLPADRPLAESCGTGQGRTSHHPIGLEGRADRLDAARSSTRRWSAVPRTAASSSAKTRWTWANDSNKPIDRILCFHPDGKITVFAEKLYAVFGLAYIDGKVYVHHCPKFSVFTDDNGVGKDRNDLIDRTNPQPSTGVQRPHPGEHPPRHGRLPLHERRRQGHLRRRRHRRHQGRDLRRRRPALPPGRHASSKSSPPARATTSTSRSTPRTRCSPTTTPTTATAGGPASRTWSTAASTATRGTTSRASPTRSG